MRETVVEAVKFLLDRVKKHDPDPVVHTKAAAFLQRLKDWESEEGAGVSTQLGRHGEDEEAAG